MERADSDRMKRVVARGRLLSALKVRVKREGSMWEPFVESNLPWSTRSVTDYIKAAKNP